MGTSRATKPAPDTRPLPEILRSQLVGHIVAAALDHAVDEADGNDWSAATTAVLTTTAQEIRDWHAPKPAPAEQNGAY